MIKLEIVDIKDFRAIGTEIEVKEIGRKATKNEKEVSNILKKRLKIDEKLQIESNKEELKEQIEKFIINYFIKVIAKPKSKF